MIVEIRRSKIAGNVTAPPSKSMTHRALMCSALASGKSLIRSPLISDDTEATSRVLQELGIRILDGSDPLEVHGGTLKAPRSDLFCGESGTTLRFMTALCSLIEGECTLTGGPSLSKRPVEPLLEALRQIGVDSESKGGYPPIKVKGRGRIGDSDVHIRGDISSQFVSALLLIAPLSNGMRINLTTPLESKPYVKMTMDALRTFGVTVQASNDMLSYLIKKQAYRPVNMMVEGDWSSAANILAAGTLAGKVTVENLSPKSGQADTAIIDILKTLGARIQMAGRRISVEKSDLRAIEVDLSNSPDIFTVTASLCATASGVSVLRGLRRLRYKESDRVAAMMEGLQKMGVNVKQEEDVLKIEGCRPKGDTIDPHNDHRIAMAFSVLGLVSEGETTILDAGCVSKSYPRFWEDMEIIGADIKRSEND
ncbi:3-phosphoshikimate 1-carboxyvinyltransferase [Candidatus Bathyarchaeota archaeon RBG_13_60_20]|nr:MAG: 3-phosphoshikimate 1-carboxyvinyltransferase [Candidatus Bathyarchaeota archaeon RBG_13_60_20]